MILDDELMLPSNEIQIKPCSVVLQKLELSSIIAYCIVHNVYNCNYCKNDSIDHGEGDIVNYTTYSPLHQEINQYSNDNLTSMGTFGISVRHYLERNKKKLKEILDKPKLELDNYLCINAIEEAESVLNSSLPNIKKYSRKQRLVPKFNDAEEPYVIVKTSNNKIDFSMNCFLNDIFKAITENKNCLNEQYRLMPWDTFEERFDNRSIAIWYSSNTKMPQLVITGGRKPSRAHCNIRYLTNVNEHIIAENAIVKSLLERRVPANKPPNSVSIIVAYNKPFWKICGICENKTETVKKPAVVPEDNLFNAFQNNTTSKPVSNVTANETENMVQIPYDDDIILQHIEENRNVLFCKKRQFQPKKLLSDSPVDENKIQQVLWASIPNVTLDCKWRIVYVNVKFDYLCFSSKKYSIKYDDIMKALKMTQSDKSTIILRIDKVEFLHQDFGIYCVHDYQDKIFVGPYFLNEIDDLDALNIDNGVIVHTGLLKDSTDNSKFNGALWFKQVACGGPNLRDDEVIVVDEPVTTIDLTYRSENEQLNTEKDSLIDKAPLVRKPAKRKLLPKPNILNKAYCFKKLKVANGHQNNEITDLSYRSENELLNMEKNSFIDKVLFVQKPAKRKLLPKLNILNKVYCLKKMKVANEHQNNETTDLNYRSKNELLNMEKNCFIDKPPLVQKPAKRKLLPKPDILNKVYCFKNLKVVNEDQNREITENVNNYQNNKIIENDTRIVYKNMCQPGNMDITPDSISINKHITCDPSDIRYMAACQRSLTNIIYVVCPISQPVKSFVNHMVTPESVARNPLDPEQEGPLDFEESLIKEIEKRPALWDHRIALSQRSKQIKNQLWLDLSLIFNKEVDELQKKWRYIRDTFVRTKVEVDAYVPSGSCAKKKKTGWRFHNSLQFLRDVVQMKRTNIPFTPPDSPSTLLASNDEANLTTPTKVLVRTCQKTKKDNMQGNSELENVPIEARRAPTTPILETAGFLAVLGAGLNRLSRSRRRALQIKLLQLLSEAENGAAEDS